MQNEIIEEDESDDGAMLQSNDQKNRHARNKNRESETLEAVKQPAV